MSESKSLPLVDQTPHALELPEAPAGLTGPVRAWRQPVQILTYEPDQPDQNPMFLEKRVYQGSSGRVYPLPFYDRIATEPVDRSWDAIHIENEYLRVMILPEIGGRIHIGYDKTTGYDFFYRQNVIKPDLVGLAGPWISGGVEFNWPQHHRPATFMPVDTEIEQHDDGSATVWCSDHDPMLRLKGMHGVCLRPGRALLELKVRLFNRTPFTQTFLWWANVATRVHEHYQSFFPTDVRFVADHAKRAITSFPFSDRPYYGVDYPERARDGVPADQIPANFIPDGTYPPNDLSRYANIPVPTSYMITGTSDDFFGGYDHARQAGVVHVANHHIAPGKKQWTWGNHEFGYAWDRSLTDTDGPYIELMAGVYTDNQPDFSFLVPWETKTFTQSWFPIHAIGVPQAANMQAALHLDVVANSARVNLQVTHDEENLEITLQVGGREFMQAFRSVTVAEPLRLEVGLPGGVDGSTVAVVVRRGAKLLIEHDPAKIVPAKTPVVAREPGSPSEIASVEELYLTGLHLEQYRHATRAPQPYWEEGLTRDAGNSRIHNALGLWRLRRGEFNIAAVHFKQALARLTVLNPNPYDGEPYYNLGLAQHYLANDEEAYDAFYKATWNAAWRAPAYFALAEIDAKRGDWEVAQDHLQRSLRAEADNLNARNLLVVVLRALGHEDLALETLKASRELDPLDIGSRWIAGLASGNAQEHLDLAYDFLRAGQADEAARVLRSAISSSGPVEGALPIVLLTLADLEASRGQAAAAQTSLAEAEEASLAYCFPSRLEEMIVLQNTLQRHPESATAAYLLGNLLYDRRRHEEAIALWEVAARARPDFATVWRNLGIARFNVQGDATSARSSFDRALAANPEDGRILYERDQLWKRVGENPETRLAELERYPLLVEGRDDLSIEKATLLNQLSRPAEALAVLETRHFQPWEGGEGLVLEQYVRSHLLLGRAALDNGKAQQALEHFQSAKNVPQNLSEAKHLLANQSDIDFWLGEAYQALGDRAGAHASWQRAASQRGDFQQMSVRTISSMTYWNGMAQLRLSDEPAARRTFEAILAYAEEFARTEPKIDYFATSLPTLLLFEDDLNLRNRIEAMLLRGQAQAGLGDAGAALGILKEVLALDSNHAVAADLLQGLQHALAETH